MNIMYLYGHEVDDDVDFLCINVENGIISRDYSMFLEWLYSRK